MKFTHQGGIEIGVHYDPATKLSSIVVTDTGIGIAPEHHDKIFDDFRQVDDSPSRQYGGTGLGLAIVRDVAEIYDGTVSLEESEDLGGLLARLKLPEAAQGAAVPGS